MRMPQFLAHSRAAPPSDGLDPQLRAWLLSQGRALLQEFVVYHRLPVRLQTRRPGVMRAEFGFHPGDIPVSRLESREDVAARVFRTDDVRVSVEQGLVFFSVPLPPEFVDVIDPWKLPAADSLRVPIGINEGDKPVWWDMGRNPHLLIGGPTQTGKSVVARFILKGLLASNLDFRFTVIGAQPDDWDATAYFRQSWGFHGVDAAPAAVDWLLSEHHRRKEARVKTPPVVVFVDDLLALLDKRTGHPDLLQPLTTLFVQTRHQGFHLIAGVQVATGFDGLGILVKQTPRRIVTGAGSPDEAFRLAGVKGTGAERLRRGEVISVETGHATLTYVPRFEDTDLAQMPGGAPDPAPWMAQRPTTGTTVATPVAPPGRVSPLRVVRPEALTRPTTPVATPDTTPSITGGALLPRRAPLPAEYPVIRAAWEAEGRMNGRTCRRLWGYKDGKTLAWLKAALEGDA